MTTNFLEKFYQRSAGRVRAITMWDFSWIERRWPGSGYEDWGAVLDELVERGYDAVRIDAYPHLHAIDPFREWEILPCWNQQVWGSPAKNRIRLQPGLTNFISECAKRDILVGLSSWYQDDTTHARLAIPTPEVHARQWVGVLKDIEAAGLLDSVLYVDLCNEWPFSCWAPFFNFLPDPDKHSDFTSPRSLEWMDRAMRCLKEHFELPATFSLVGLPRDSAGTIETLEIEAFDFWEPHLWMVHANRDEFNKRIGYTYPRWDSSGYEAVVDRARPLYTSAPEYWQTLLRAQIAEAAEFSRSVQRPLVTTECWGIVDYKDWPLLDWDWVKELCEVGSLAAAATGCWGAIATSNFCGPQFVGMWRDVAWHQRLTAAIRQSSSLFLSGSASQGDSRVQGFRPV